jgi:hypothetical protein
MRQSIREVAALPQPRRYETAGLCRSPAQRNPGSLTRLEDHAIICWYKG